MIDEYINNWLQLNIKLNLAPNTINAYRNALMSFQQYCDSQNVHMVKISREEIANYIHSLLNAPIEKKVAGITYVGPLSNSTVRQRITVIRLFYRYLVEEGQIKTNPVERISRINRRMCRNVRGLVPIQHKIPWIPNDQEWMRLLLAARDMKIRNRFMLALAYDAGLRREELCSLRTEDIDPAHRLLHIRAETTKGKRDRIVPYSVTTGLLLLDYLRYRKQITSNRNDLFVSESPRNYGKPITFWSWSKIIRALANTAELPRFSTHTLRHLCLTDLARSGWELNEIATFAGHRQTSTTMLYIHLSGRDLAGKLAAFSAAHSQRLQKICEYFNESEG